MEVRSRALSLTYSSVQSLFLHRISVVCVYLSIADTTQDPAGQDPHQVLDDSFPERNVKCLICNIG